MKKRLWIVLLLIVPLLADAQRWKRYRWEAVGGIGVSNFLGELGGANQIGTDYFRDLELSMTKFAALAGLRYKLNLYTALRTTFTYGVVAGDDKLTTEEFRSNRNLNFKASIYELSTQFEFSWMRDRVGHRYRLRGVRGQKNMEIYIYGFVGAGLFYYNPKGQLPTDGTWHNLQPLGTEGQGIIPTRDKYTRFSATLPFGFGFRYALSRDLGVGLEFGLRKTFTDYIDDASTTYVDSTLFTDQTARTLADPSGASNWRWTAGGQQRGDPSDKDSYMFAIFSVNYKLRTRRRHLPKF